MIAVDVMRTVAQGVMVMFALALVAGTIGAISRLIRGVTLPPEERRRPHFMRRAAPPTEDLRPPTG
jgi:uncharacterized membrane protein YagU involved in acid resistance